MGSKLIFLGIAAIAGASMAVQGTFNSVLSKAVGLLESTFIVHVVGTILILGLLVFGLGRGSFTQYNQAPWYVYLGGVLSVIIIYAVASAISEVGVGDATTAIIAGQMSFALLIDHLGLFGAEKIPTDWRQLIGLVLFAVGASLLLR